MERMENDRITNTVNVGECVGSGLVGSPQMRWIDTVKDCLRKRSGCQASKENGA